MSAVHAWMVALTLVADVVPPGRTVSKDEGVVISVVATSDLHGRLEALPWLGGHLANLRRQRAADGGAVVLVDAGDMFQGTLESNQAEGAPVVEAYNALGYAAAALGNHEFDFGPEGPALLPARPGEDARGALKARARQARFPFLAANLEQAHQPVAWPNVRPSVLIEVAGIKVGLVGVTTPSTATTTLPVNVDGLTFAPLAPAMAREAARLRAQGAQVIIGLAHEGGRCTRFGDPDDLASCDVQSEIMALARALPEGVVDVLVAGHTHQGIAHRVGRVPVIQAYSLGRAFGRVDLIVDRVTGHVRDTRLFVPHFVCGEKGEASRADCRPRPYEGGEVQADARVEALLAPAFKRAESQRRQDTGVTLAADFRHNGERETPLGNLVVDLLRQTHPHADVALMTGGNIRAGLPAGRLEFGALFEALPFDNSLATLRLTGAQLSRLFVRQLERPGRPILMSGLRVEARCEAGRLVVRLRRDDDRPVKPDERLTIVTNDFLATGGDGLFGKVKANIEGHRLVRDTIFELLKKRGGTLDPNAPALTPTRLMAPGPRPVRCGGPG